MHKKLDYIEWCQAITASGQKYASGFDVTSPLWSQLGLQKLDSGHFVFLSSKIDRLEVWSGV